MKVTAHMAGATCVREGGGVEMWVVRHTPRVVLFVQVDRDFIQQPAESDNFPWWCKYISILVSCTTSDLSHISLRKWYIHLYCNIGCLKNEHGENVADISLASFYRKEIFAVLDQIITDCRENGIRLFLNIKPFSVLLPHWNDISEILAEDLCKLLGGRITSGSFLGELSVLRDGSVSILPATWHFLFFKQWQSLHVPSNERSFSKLK